MGAYKKFSEKFFRENDPKARKIVSEFFRKKGYVMMPNGDRYGPDLKLYKNHQEFEKGNFAKFIECEIKRVWKEDKFPYGSVQFPERKAKYIYQTDKPVVFFMLNLKCNKALMVKGEDILKSPLKVVPNIYVKQDEMFFQVPLDKVTFFDIE